MVTQYVEQKSTMFIILFSFEKNQFNRNKTILTINSNIYKQKNIYRK